MIKEEPRGHGATRTRDAGNERKALSEPHDDGVAHGQVFLHPRMAAHPFGPNEHEREQDENRGSHPQVAEIVSDEIFEDVSKNSHGNGAHNHHPPHAVVGPALRFVHQTSEPSSDDSPNVLGKKYQHCRFCPQLNDSGE